jgi:hypothetical protein
MPDENRKNAEEWKKESKEKETKRPKGALEKRTLTAKAALGVS